MHGYFNTSSVKETSNLWLFRSTSSCDNDDEKNITTLKRHNLAEFDGILLGKNEPAYTEDF